MATKISLEKYGRPLDSRTRPAIKLKVFTRTLKKYAPWKVSFYFNFSTEKLIRFVLLKELSRLPISNDETFNI